MSRLAAPEGKLIAQGIGVLVILGSGLIFMVMKILRSLVFVKTIRVFVPWFTVSIVNELTASLVSWIIAPLMRRRYTEWYKWQFRFVPDRAKWDEMDCLPKSKLLRLFAHTKLIAGPALSSFEVFVNEDNRAIL